MFLWSRLRCWTGGAAASQPRIAFGRKWITAIQFKGVRISRNAGEHTVSGCGGTTVNCRRRNSTVVVVMVAVDDLPAGKGRRRHFLLTYFLFRSLIQLASGRGSEYQIRVWIRPKELTQLIMIFPFSLSA